MEKINGDAETNIEFNPRLSENITNKYTYTDFNDAILQAAKVAITTKLTNQGWFNHSKDHLLLAIELRDHLLTILRNMNEEDTRNVRLQLRQAHTCVTDLIALEKASWSAYQAKKNHNMSFNPKAAWESVKILTGGTTIHHANPTIMRMRLPTGKLPTTDKENAEVLGPHFEKVFKKHRRIEWNVIDEIKQRQTMYELN